MFEKDELLDLIQELKEKIQSLREANDQIRALEVELELAERSGGYGI